MVARPLRLLVANGVYHVTARGIASQAIYEDDFDRRGFLRVLGRTVSRFGWRCLTYCLMINHFHLVVRTPEPNLARGMQQLSSQYAQRYNQRHERIGPLFAGRYGAKLIQRDAHLLEVFRYVALNPVRAGVCAEPTAWRWGAHCAITGQRQAPGWLAVDEVRTLFAGYDDGGRVYRRFVDTAPDVALPADGVAVGDVEFLRRVLPSTKPGPDIAERDWGEGRPPLGELLSVLDSGQAIAVAYRKHGYTMSRIAAEMGCHVCTVSRRLKAYERQMLESKI